MAEARVVRPDRRQLRWDMIDLEGLLPADHRARSGRGVSSRASIFHPFTIRFSRARAKREGRPPIILLSLWLYATIEGVGSARELERLAQSDAAYRWLAGGVPLNHENGIFIFTNAALGLGSLWKLSLAIVFFQCGHGVLKNDYKVL